MKYALNLGKDGRILSACYCLDGFKYKNVVEYLPDDNILDYKYIAGEFVHDPLPVKPEIEAKPTADEVLDALLGTGGEM